MPKVGNPITLARGFGLDPEALSDRGVLNATLAIDTKLFIDPLLLEHSDHPEISQAAVAQYRHYFEIIIKLLAVSTARNDVPWRNAKRHLEFHEIPGTCLGYGAGIRGSGFGRGLSDHLIATAKAIVDLGVNDPDLFVAMALFEDDIGPDRISDMTTNVVFKALASFNERILDELGLEGEEFVIRDISCRLLRNPTQNQPTPVVLVPIDILRDLPIARDWDGVESAAAKNNELRNRVNQHIAHIWVAKSKRRKAELRAQALTSSAAFSTLLDAIHEVGKTQYDVARDSAGLVRWSQSAEEITSAFPLNIKAAAQPKTLAYVHEIATLIVGQFRHLIENCGLNKELYKENRQPRHEPTSQRLFFAVAYSYCKANDLDISPEIDTGTGAVDFKFSSGFNARTLVEIKLSTNSRIVPGYESQLEIYKQSQETMSAIYLVIDVGKMGAKDTRLIKIRNDAHKAGEPLSDLEFVDGMLKRTASKR